MYTNGKTHSFIPKKIPWNLNQAISESQRLRPFHWFLWQLWQREPWMALKPRNIPFLGAERIPCAGRQTRECRPLMSVAVWPFLRALTLPGAGLGTELRLSFQQSHRQTVSSAKPPEHSRTKTCRWISGSWPCPSTEIVTNWDWITGSETLEKPLTGVHLLHHKE